MTDATRYPLSWPTGWKRTRSDRRQHAKFSATARSTAAGTRWRRDVSLSEAIDRVRDQLRRLGVAADHTIISTNVPTRKDGLPSAAASEPADPGVAVYWRTTDAHRVMAIDHYTRCADNLAAIAATLDALRAIERHGGGMILDRAFAGFTALPAPDDWRQTFEYAPHEHPTLADVAIVYRHLCRQRHPDLGGTHEAMAALNRAWESAQRELASSAERTDR